MHPPIAFRARCKRAYDEFGVKESRGIVFAFNSCQIPTEKKKEEEKEKEKEKGEGEDEERGNSVTGDITTDNEPRLPCIANSILQRQPPKAFQT